MLTVAGIFDVASADIGQGSAQELASSLVNIGGYAKGVKVATGSTPAFHESTIGTA